MYTIRKICNSKGFTMLEMSIVLSVMMIIFSFIVSPFVIRMKSIRCQAMANNIDSEVKEYIDWFKGRYTDRSSDHAYYNQEFQSNNNAFESNNKQYYTLNLSIDRLNSKYGLNITPDYYGCIETESAYAGKVINDTININIPFPILTNREFIEFSLAEKTFLYGEFHNVQCPQGHLDTGSVIEYCNDSNYQLDNKQDKSYRAVK